MRDQRGVVGVPEDWIMAVIVVVDIQRNRNSAKFGQRPLLPRGIEGVQQIWNGDSDDNADDCHDNQKLDQSKSPVLTLPDVSHRTPLSPACPATVLDVESWEMASGTH